VSTVEIINGGIVIDLHPGLLLKCWGRASLLQFEDLLGFTVDYFDFKQLLC